MGNSNCRQSVGGLHKGAVSQRFHALRVFKGLGVAKRYCSTNFIGNTFIVSSVEGENSPARTLSVRPLQRVPPLPPVGPQKTAPWKSIVASHA